VRFDPHLDIDQLVKQIIAADLDTSRFGSVDAKIGLPLAPNIFAWFTEPQFCGVEGFKPWPKQIFTLSSVLEEHCPMPCCTDKAFFQSMFNESLDEIQSRVTFLEHGRCPRCKATRLDFLNDGLFHNITECNLCLGQRASKTSMIAGFLAPYILHHYVGTPDLTRLLGVKPGQEIYFSLLALTAGQALKYPWTDFRNSYNSSKWFTDYNEALKYLAKKESWEFEPVKVLDTKIEYPVKNLYVGVETPNKRTIRGATRAFAMIDEFGWFPDDDTRETASASETEDALGNALLTIRGAVGRIRKAGNLTFPNAILAKSSSPHYVGDPILREIIGSDLFRTISGTYLSSAFLRNRTGFLGYFYLQ